MILDVGCIQFVIDDIGEAGVVIIIFCRAVIIIGMVTFTSAVIGYLTNYISDFIKNANAGARKLYIKPYGYIEADNMSQLLDTELLSLTSLTSS